MKALTGKSSENGITIMALIVTIIVIMVLSGSSIVLLTGENGIIKQTINAKEEVEEDEEEKGVQLAVMAALNVGNGYIEKGNGFNVLNNKLKELGYEGDEINQVPSLFDMQYSSYYIDKWGVVKPVVTIESFIGKTTTEKISLIDENFETMILPSGFSITTDSATLIKQGVVVKAPDGSEFVWVPVKNINSMVKCESSDDDCDIGVNEYEQLVCKRHNNNVIYGKLYVGADYSRFTPYLKEPAVITNLTKGDKSSIGLNLLKNLIGIEGTIGTDDDDMLNTWKNQLRQEFGEMAKSVYKNKGFYVGRYETSVRESEEKIAQSKFGIGILSATAEETSANTWYGLYQLEKEYSQKNNLGDIVGSNMIWGCQYDQMLLWMKKNNINISSKTPITGASKNTDRTTGSKANDKLNNIYDLLGNSYEWTLEAYNNNNAEKQNGRISRGGCYNKSEVLEYRGYGYAYEKYETNSSRIALYIK